MIQIVLLVLGIIAAIRYPRLTKLSASDYPGVDPDAFARWLSAEKAAAIWLIVATIGVFVVQLVGGLAVGAWLGATRASQQTIENATMTVAVGGIALFLGLLVVAAICGSKAAKLKRAIGITWPKK